ncbi:unnamed protein product [Macrosiphum euphorbiae]|uniref:Uncharacterized protein n=2 Tax=Macrosiphum euphorbiae TaxID=13131 RepID=A0AAV0WSY3_9HEMI|nr:unnamed protein product [Macrosiphum euphorbiae]
MRFRIIGYTHIQLNSVPTVLLRLWGRAGIAPDRVDTFMRYGITGVDKCILCQICVMSSCEIVFKPAGRWLEVILDIFPRNKHVTSAQELIDASYGFSGEILDFGHQIAYRPRASSVTRDGLLMARVLRWGYRLYRAIVNDCTEELKIETKDIFLYSVKAAKWNSDSLMTLCRCYLLHSGQLDLLGVGTNSTVYLHYSDKFHDYMMANKQFDHYNIYNLTIQWYQIHNIKYPRVTNGTVPP